MKSRHRPRIVVIGSSNTDLVVQCARLPRPGETQLGGQFARHPGGKGANQAVAAARAGARVAFVGAHGDDDFGRDAKAGLLREGIDTTHFRELPGESSGIALILIGGRSRENLIAVAKSANDCVSPEDVLAAEGMIAKSDAVLCQLEIPGAPVEMAAALANRYGVPFFLNPAPARRLSARLLRRVHTLIPNKSEAEALSGCSGAEAASRILRGKGCHQVVITLGARGALLCDEAGVARIPAPRIKALDTVGAGDCFSAWLAVGIANGLSLHEASLRAVRAASLAVTRAGAQAGMPTRDDLDG
jgi:ribokinase